MSKLEERISQAISGGIAGAAYGATISDDFSMACIAAAVSSVTVPAVGYLIDAIRNDNNNYQ